VRQSDVRRFVAYIYGPKGNRPVLPVEGYLPGLPTGDPDLDTASLLSQHHGGKAGKGRSVVFSSEYFRDRETAIAHAPAMVKAASAFRLAWAPNSNGLSVVHLTEGRDQYAGMWRLDAHLLLANSDGVRGLQWTRKQCSEMQELNWIPQSVQKKFQITPGKGTGVRRTEKLPYPKAQNLICYEIGTLTDRQIATGISCGAYGAPRRTKNGRIISIEAEGCRINIARARHLVAVRDGASGCHRSLHSGGSSKRPDTQWNARTRLDPEAPIPLLTKRFDFDLGGRGKGGDSRSTCRHLLRQRRRRVSGHRSAQFEGPLGILALGNSVGRGTTASLATDGKTRAVLSRVKAAANQINKVLGDVESIQLLR